MDITLIAPLTREQARTLINTVRNHLTQIARHEELARQAALQFQEGEGWKSLGYPNLRACFQQELGVSWQHGYRLANAAEVDQDLSDFSPTGETFVIPETHARQLHKLPADKRYVAYAHGVAMAAAEGVKPAARHMEKAVGLIEDEIFVQSNPVVARAVAAGEITSADGVKIKRELDSLPAPHQARVMDIMTRHGLRDSRLVVPLAEMSTRPKGKESKVLEEIERTGHVAGVPLAEASFSDLKRLKEEAQNEHISEGMEKKRQQQMAMGGPVQEAVVVTVWTNNPGKTIDALVRALPLDDLKAVAERLMQHVIDQLEKEQH